MKATIANWNQTILDVEELYSKLKNLWNELGDYTKVPI